MSGAAAPRVPGDRQGGLTYDEIDALVASRYADGTAGDTPEERLFVMLVDVADRYLHELERGAADDPAPYFAGATPMVALINGLAENLDMRREDRT